MTKVLHVLLVLGHPNQPYMTDLFEGLAKSNEDVHHLVLCNKNLTTDLSVHHLVLGDKNDLFKIGAFSYLIKNILTSTTVLPLVRQRRFKSRVKFLLKWRYLIECDAQVIHIHHLHIVPLSILQTLKSKSKKIIVSLRGKDLVINTLDLKGKEQFLEKLELCDKIHVNSDYFIQLATLKGIERTKLVRTYRGVKIDTYLKEDLNILHYHESKDTLKIIVVGRLEWEKGHAFILESLNRLRKKNIRIQCDFYGEGSFREFLEFRIYQLGLEDIVSVKGHLSNEKLRQEYKNYHVALQPSLYESLPNGLLEMCLYNLPCVVSNVGGMSEFILHGVNGICFDINEPISLDTAILDCAILNKKDLMDYNQSLFDKFSFKEGIKNLNNIYLQIQNH
ncbi:glycosyltransferase family 4 protein [Bizionia sp.]|uniref:glycosyltransferase family 4 protein n=1 Tax=Bizionia sp. TaxID=1954480 RepID=UPI003A8DF345